MKNLLLTLVPLLFTQVLFGAEVKIEPVYGFERTYHRTPEPARYKTEAFYGIRGTYGNPTLSAELELNQSQNSYTIGDTKTATNSQKLLFGARLTPIQTSLYNIYLRGGIRAQKVKREVTTNGNTTNQDDPVHFDPYAGTGLSFNLAGILSLNTSATLVFNKDAESSEQYDTRYTFSVTFKFGSETQSF